MSDGTSIIIPPLRTIVDQIAVECQYLNISMVDVSKVKLYIVSKYANTNHYYQEKVNTLLEKLNSKPKGVLATVDCFSNTEV